MNAATNPLQGYPGIDAYRNRQLWVHPTNACWNRRLWVHPVNVCWNVKGVQGLWALESDDLDNVLALSTKLKQAPDSYTISELWALTIDG